MPLNHVPESEFPEGLLPQPVRHKADMPSVVEIPYEELPNAVKQNLTPGQWMEAQFHVIPEGGLTSDSTVYLNLKNGKFQRYPACQRAPAPLLAAHNLAGGRGADDTQFRTAPAQFERSPD